MPVEFVVYFSVFDIQDSHKKYAHGRMKGVLVSAVWYMIFATFCPELSQTFFGEDDRVWIN